MIFLRINSHNFSCSMLDTTPPLSQKISHRFCTIHVDDAWRIRGGPRPATPLTTNGVAIRGALYTAAVKKMSYIFGLWFISNSCVRPTFDKYSSTWVVQTRTVVRDSQHRNCNNSNINTAGRTGHATPVENFCDIWFMWKCKLMLRSVCRCRNATSCQFSWPTCRLISTTSTRVLRRRLRTPAACAHSCRRQSPTTRTSRADSTKNSSRRPRSWRRSGKFTFLVMLVTISSTVVHTCLADAELKRRERKSVIVDNSCSHVCLWAPAGMRKN